MPRGNQTEKSQEWQRTVQEWLYPEIFAGINLDGRTGSAMNAGGRFFRNIERNRLWGGAGLELSWNPGQAVYQVLAAKQELQASRYLLKAGRNGVILEAVQAFLDLENAQLRYDALQQQRRQFSPGLLPFSLEFRLTNGMLGPFRGMSRNNGNTFGDGRYENTLDAAVYLGWNLPLA